MKHLFIINPTSGKGKGFQLINKIEEIFKNRDDEYNIEITKYPNHACEITRSYVTKGNYRIYAVGGDGTLNEVLNGMVHSTSSLAVIPAGSGNDFARTIYKNYDFEYIIENILDGKEETIDIGKINDRFFLNVSSIGIDAEVVYNAGKIKKLPFITGSLAYLFGIFMTVFKYTSYSMDISIDNQEVTEKVLLAAVGNGIFYGGGMKVLPKASIKDGMLDLCIVKHMSKFNILRLFPLLIKGQHESICDFVTFYRGRKISIQAVKELSINIDGELHREKNISFEILPKKIKFIVP